MNYTKGKRFLDTNILFYSCDTSDAIKHQKALNLIAECSQDNSGVLPVQVLGELFHATVVRKKLLTAEEGERAVIAFRSAMKCASIDPQDVSDAIEVHRRYQTRYWDSLIIAIAARLECTEILSEDLNDGQTYMGVLVSNPFRVE